MKWMMTLALMSVMTACNATTAKPPHATASSVGSPQAAFHKYQTFTFAPANPPVTDYETTARSLEVQRRLTPLVQASLEKRGYAQSADSPDLLIKISSGSKTVSGEAATRGSATGQASRGFIGVDAYDRATGADVWHGSAVAEIDPARIDDALLARGVEGMLADFPVRREQLPQATPVR